MIDAPVEVALAPTPIQRRAIACPVEDMLYGGARGGGKSVFLYLDWLAHAQASGGRARGLVLRRTREQLRDFIEEGRRFMPKIGWTYHEQKHQWTGPDGCILTLAYLERDQDAENYQGWNLSWLAVDEAGNFPSPVPIDKLRACLRIPGLRCFMRLTANPGGPGHHWLKERYVTPSKPGKAFVGADGIQRVFLPAKVRDNPHLDHATYERNLAASGPAWLVKAWLDGDWDIQPAGGIFDVDKVNFGELPTLDFPITGWDTAFTEDTRNDESSAMHIGRDAGRRFWLANLWHGRLDLGKLPQQVLVLRRSWQPRQVVCEGGPAGRALEPLVNNLMRDDMPFSFKLVSHMSDKVAKNAAFASVCNSGQLWVPKGAAWWPYLRDQMLTFDGTDGRLDDCIDAGGVAFRELDRIMASAAPVDATPTLPDRARIDVMQRRISEIRKARGVTAGPKRMFG